jgi:hypothetical protein
MHSTSGNETDKQACRSASAWIKKYLFKIESDHNSTTSHRDQIKKAGKFPAF